MNDSGIYGEYSQGEELVSIPKSVLLRTMVSNQAAINLIQEMADQMDVVDEILSEYDAPSGEGVTLVERIIIALATSFADGAEAARIPVQAIGDAAAKPSKTNRVLALVVAVVVFVGACFVFAGFPFTH